jgi:hypothetical protein
VSSVISDRVAIALSLGFGLVGGVITTVNRSWVLGLVVGVVIAAAVQGSIVATAALLARDTGAPAPMTRRRTAVAQAEEFVTRCRQALADLPGHDPGVRATASLLQDLVASASGSVHEHEVTTLILEDLNSATQQVERLDPESAPADVERRLRLIKQSLQKTSDIAQNLLGHSHSGS